MNGVAVDSGDGGLGSSKACGKGDDFHLLTAAGSTILSPNGFGVDSVSSSPFFFISDGGDGGQQLLGDEYHGLQRWKRPTTLDDSEVTSGGTLMSEEPQKDSEKLLQTSLSHMKNVQPKPHSASARSCTKVHKKGIALGRSVDLTKFSGYDELIAKLDQLLEFGGELTSPKKDWLIVYTDNEGDMMLVGDDPWPEFCAMACKMYIYPKEEIQKMTPGTLS